LKHVSEISKIIAKKVDVEIYLDDSDPFAERLIPQHKIEIRRKAAKPLRKLKDYRVLKKNIKSALMGFPTKETARSLNTPFGKLNKIFWSTMDVNYYNLHKRNKLYYKKLFGKDNVHITGKETDLKFSIKNRDPIVDSGLWTKEKYGYLNLPAGEVFLAPVETSVNGEIYFDLPNLHYGMQIKGVWFKFKNGRLVDYSVDKGLNAFEDVYKHASGDKDRIGELGIGTNPKAKMTGGMIIVDEKVLGTIHMAIGHNKHMLGKNDATIHWDFFKDMKKGSSLEVDGKIMLLNGKLV
jgi:aminopeptidase